MKAMILAAGLGTRLRPLTLNKPKALIPVGNQPMIDRVIRYLTGYNVDHVIVNVHHHPNQMTAHLGDGSFFGIRVQTTVEPRILGTGGGIKNTEGFWDSDPFIVINSDILTDIHLDRALDAHQSAGNLATLILHDYGPFNQVRISRDLDILDIGSDKAPGRLAFTGIHILAPDILDAIPGQKFVNIIDCYRTLIRKGYPVRAHISKGHYWRDVGTIESYLRANRDILEGDRVLSGPGCRIDPRAVIKDWAVVGPGTTLEPGAVVERSVLWENVTVKKGIRVTDSVVASSLVVQRNTAREALCSLT